MLLFGLCSLPAAATTPVLVMTAGGVTKEFTADELLTRPDTETVSVLRDPSYDGAMNYRGAPLRALLSAFPSDLADKIQARARDGFVAEIPRALISGAAVPWIAVEDAAHPWPPLRGKDMSAGPFYLVWQYPERAPISPEQWVYAQVRPDHRLAGAVEAVAGQAIGDESRLPTSCRRILGNRLIDSDRRPTLHRRGHRGQCD